MSKKDDKIYDEYEIEFILKDLPREDLRKNTVDKFLSEKGGYWENGIKHVTRYKYYVEKIRDGRRVFLFRPTFLNKGIDFQVWVERMNGSKDERPSHKGVMADLMTKKQENPKNFSLLMDAIDDVWNCEEPDDVLKKYTFSFTKGLEAELLLKILKWLFIEQDITYWNYDGRGMLKIALDKLK